MSFMDILEQWLELREIRGRAALDPVWRWRIEPTLDAVEKRMQELREELDARAMGGA